MLQKRLTLKLPVQNSGGSRRGARGTRTPSLFLDQTEARRAEKNFRRPSPPPHFNAGSGWPAPTPLYLKIWIRHCKREALVFLLPKLTNGSGWFPPIHRWPTRTIRVRWRNFALCVFPLSSVFCRFLSSNTAQLNSFFFLTKICLKGVRVCL